MLEFTDWLTLDTRGGAEHGAEKTPESQGVWPRVVRTDDLAEAEAAAAGGGAELLLAAVAPLLAVTGEQTQTGHAKAASGAHGAGADTAHELARQRCLRAVGRADAAFEGFAARLVARLAAEAEDEDRAAAAAAAAVQEKEGIENICACEDGGGQ